MKLKWTCLLLSAVILLTWIVCSHAQQTNLFIVFGKVFLSDGVTYAPDGTIVIVENLNTGASISTTVGATEPGKYIVVFIDFEGNRAAAVGDQIKITVKSPEGELLANPNPYTVTAENITARRVRIDITFTGGIIDVTAMSQIDKFNIRFDRATGKYSMMATWKNKGAVQFSQPLQMVIESITPSTVTVANRDGTTPEGKPYFDYSTLVGDGKLAPGETSSAKQLIFNNPNRLRFEFVVSCWARVSGGGAPRMKPVGQAKLIHIVIPVVSALAQNYPNPFNPETWIPYELAEASNVKISIYDLKGSLVRTIDLSHHEVGQYFTKEKAAYWDGRNNLGEKTSSGIYFYQIQSGDFQAVRKMVILK